MSGLARAEVVPRRGAWDERGDGGDHRPLVDVGQHLEHVHPVAEGLPRGDLRREKERVRERERERDVCIHISLTGL